MKFLIVLAFVLQASLAEATCDLMSPKFRAEMVEHFKRKTNTDISKAFQFTSFKQGHYAVFIVQMRRGNKAKNDSEIQTFTVTTSCNHLGLPMIDNELEWSVLLSNFPET